VSTIDGSQLGIVAIIAQNCTVAQVLVEQLYADGLRAGYGYILLADRNTCNLDELKSEYAMLLTFEQSSGERFDSFVSEIGEP
jgi:hypothetical protein